MNRIQIRYIIKDLAKKMVFLAGPRQAGKTYIAKRVAEHFNHALYLNADNNQDRNIIQEEAWLSKTDLLTLDELHKMPNWKNYLKGIYDTRKSNMPILVTGSARFDIFDKLGDSLAGRYFLQRLLPLSPAELFQLNVEFSLDYLLERGGFPEPYLAENEVEANRWRMQYTNSMLTMDVFEFDKVQNIKAMRMVFELLVSKVGSPISYNSISEDIAISPNTVKKYIEILEALYIVFRVTPYSNNIARSLLKEPKIYFFDTGLIKESGAKLENLVAVCLLKHVYAKIDYQAENLLLHYLRTKDGEEVDFALVKDNQLQKIIEVKNSNSDISKSLYSFNKKYNIPAVQLVKNIRNERKIEGIEVRNASDFLQELFL